MCIPWDLRRLLFRQCARLNRLIRRSRKVFLGITTEENRSVPDFMAMRLSQHDHHQHHEAAALVTRHDDSRRNETTPSKPTKGKLKRTVTIRSNRTSSLGDFSSGCGADETEWPPFTDKDYIVFRFHDDREFRLLVDKPLNPKDITVEDRDLAAPRYSNNDQKNLDHTNCRDCLLPNKAVEQELFYFSTGVKSDKIKSLNRFMAEVDVKLDEQEELDMDSPMSESDSSSSGSFEFPVLQWEWTGSPVKWPKPDESVSSKRHKSVLAYLRCRRF